VGIPELQSKINFVKPCFVNAEAIFTEILGLDFTHRQPLFRFAFSF
jgi:hypothetical protein